MEPAHRDVSIIHTCYAFYEVQGRGTRKLFSLFTRSFLPIYMLSWLIALD